MHNVSEATRQSRTPKKIRIGGRGGATRGGDHAAALMGGRRASPPWNRPQGKAEQGRERRKRIRGNEATHNTKKE